MNTSHLEDPDLDALLRTADPVARLTLAASTPAALELRTSIAGTAITAETAGAETASDDSALATPDVIDIEFDLHGRRRARRLRRPLLAATAAAAVVAAGVGVAVLVPNLHDSGPAGPGAPGQPPVPHTLLTAPGWPIIDVIDGGKYGGEQHFKSGATEVDFFWVAEKNFNRDRKASMRADGVASIDGQNAWIGFTPTPPATKPTGAKTTTGVTAHRVPPVVQGRVPYEALWTDGYWDLRIEGEFASRAQFVAVAQSLRRVDTQTWLNAMPASIVKPADHRRTVQQMLADVPQPKSFDPTPLYNDRTVQDRYQVGAAATGAVTCAWIHQWVRGTAGAKRQASEAMATYPRWKILKEMDRDGAWSQGISEIAAYMNGKDGMVRRSGMTLEQWAGGAVGCHA